MFHKVFCFFLQFELDSLKMYVLFLKQCRKYASLIALNGKECSKITQLIHLKCWSHEWVIDFCYGLYHGLYD